MKKSDKISYVINKLEELYPTVPVPLNHKDPYTLLIAVLLSAQCTDERVNQITPKLFILAENPYEMVKLSINEIKEINMLDKIKEGSKLKIVVENLESKNGEIIVSASKAKKIEGWETLLKKYE